MADNPLPPPPVTGNRAQDIWLRLIYDRITQAGALLWDQLNTSGGSVDDLDLGTLGGHIAATGVHGATGNVVGVDDRPTALVGGTVLLATAVTDLSASTVNPDTTYVQSEAVAVANQAKAASDKIDALLATLRASGVLGI